MPSIPYLLINLKKDVYCIFVEKSKGTIIHSLIPLSFFPSKIVGIYTENQSAGIYPELLTEVSSRPSCFRCHHWPSLGRRVTVKLPCQVSGFLY